MNQRLVDALAATANGIVRMLLGEKVEVGVAAARWHEGFHSNITGVVGMSGLRTGLVAVHTTRDGVRALATRLLGKPNPTDDELRDTICELANMVAGNLGMNTKGILPPLASSLPSVVEGENYYLRFVGGIERLLLPLKIGKVEVLIELVLSAERGATARAWEAEGGSEAR